MSKFFVGQRVRIIRTYGGGLLGREARIVALSITANTLRHGVYVGHRLDIKNNFGVFAIVRPDDLEPILPDGHRAGDEGECILLDELLERQREAA